MEEIEGTFAGCFSEFVLESPTEDEIPATKPASCAVGSAGPPSACFDCNICLDFVTDPVVTLCGHLFCWPCIYRWLHLEPTDGDVSRNCPVCKSALSSEFSLVPLYGRGLDAKSRPDSHDVPDRPKQLRNLLPNDANASFHLPPPTQRQSTRMSQDYLLYGERRERDMGILHSTAGVLLELVHELAPDSGAKWDDFEAEEAGIEGGDVAAPAMGFLLLLCGAFLALILRSRRGT
ncbi:hypothetical protein HPP92_027621 [Vanilla planifolia]|uniref:E3 ubiquitin-protein ligase RMA n=1 Tax=Vanilla planifolia TaxID=51239 RepID=A0A835PED7_VANPL|nr:hypothetical protein HPP92_027621 [Vanilla planifolia]